NFAAAPPYYAISYTWDNPLSTTKIVVNGEPLEVREHCQYALQQTQAFVMDVNTYVWQDALCIDQQNLHEKSFQVAMMGEIYKKAESVLACVG
ncbi:hypothetical protein T440DRAFT_350103, partial [Plenodomus tracheiphilus IPT5]